MILLSSSLFEESETTFLGRFRNGTLIMFLFGSKVGDGRGGIGEDRGVSAFEIGLLIGIVEFG